MNSEDLKFELEVINKNIKTVQDKINAALHS